MKFYLCDDDRLVHAPYREKLSALCQKHSIEHEIVSYYNGEAMLDDFDKDGGFSGVLFLDINMPEIDGITVARRLQHYTAKGQIIFLTVSREHFLTAFDVQAFNYIVKDATSDARFEQVFLRAVNAVYESEQEYMLFMRGGENCSVAIRGIHYFDVLRRIMTVHYEGGSFEFISTMEKVEGQLIGQGFIRVHRAFLVYLPFVTSVSYTDLHLRDGTVIPVGRTHLAKLRRAFLDFSKTFRD